MLKQLAALATAAGVLGGAEMTARQFYSTSLVYDPEIGYVQAPGTVKWSTEAHGTSVWTSGGLRRASPPRMDRPRILVVGDSVTEALQVDDGVPFPDRLEAKLPEYQFLNAGRSTMSTADYVARAPVWRRRFAPLWTIVEVRENDFTTDTFDQFDRSHFEIAPSGELRLVPIVPPQVTRLDFRLRQRSMLLTVLYLRFGEHRAELAELLRTPAGRVARRYPVEEIVDRLADAYARRLTIALIPDYDPHAPLAATEIEQRILAHCRTRALSCVSARSTYPEFERHGTAPFGFPTSAFNVGHLNAEGHEAVARTVAAELSSVDVTREMRISE